MLIYLRKKAQSTAEYVTLFAIVVAAITLVSSKVKRTLASYLITNVKGELGISTLEDNKNVYRAGKDKEISYQGQQLTGTKENAGAPMFKSDSEQERTVIAGDVDDVATTVNSYDLSGQGAWVPGGLNIVADTATERVPPKSGHLANTE